MTEKRAELLLAAVISARATSFVFNKLVLGAAGILLILSSLLLPHLMKGKKSHEIQGDPV